MLSILALETNESPNAVEALEAGKRRHNLPIKRITVKSSHDDFVDEADSSKYNVILLSLKKVQQYHLEMVMKLRDEWQILFIIAVLADSNDVPDVAQPSIQVNSILFTPPEQSRLFKSVKEIYTRINNLSPPSPEISIAIKTGAGLKKLSVKSIYFFVSRGEKKTAKTLSQEVVFYSSWEKIMAQLPQQDFILCHQGFVINLDHVKDTQWADNIIILADGSEIPVARSKKKEVKKAIITRYPALN